LKNCKVINEISQDADFSILCCRRTHKHKLDGSKSDRVISEISQKIQSFSASVENLSSFSLKTVLFVIFL
jgi:hypothetical protein